MDFAVLKTLEFDKLLEKVASYAQSSLGRRMVLALKPFTDRRLILQSQDAGEEALSLILAFGRPPLYGIRPVQASIHRAGKGGVLTMQELLDLAEILRVSQDLVDYVAEREDKGAFSRLIESLFLFPQMEARIHQAILSEDQMADQASRALYSIRQSKKAKQDQIKEKMNQLLVQLGQAGHLTESLVTMRDGRYVLPVRSSSRSHIPGVVHDASASGATVYIEPMAVVDLNNEIRQLEVEEEEEILRILQDFSKNLAQYEEEIIGNEKALTFIDFTFAKANYALENNCHRPLFSQDQSLDLREARHPLLGPQVVPIDLRLGEEFSTLIITGPNTGGKTVSLKTLGLLQAMGQAGLQIPCRDGSKLAIFSSIYADIGDKQSIAQSLSTFSASMTNIVDILSQADEESLLLFDELGSGTDPTEGAALAMAILEVVTDRGIRTLATTHYAELKLFAMRHPGVQNASVEFDLASLSPTYRLKIGLPGRSNAFEIAKRLGLSDQVLDQAGQYLDAGNIHFETVLADIEEKQKRIEAEERRIQEERKAYRTQLESMQKQLDQAQAAYEKEMDKARQEARDLVAQAEEEAKALIKEAKKAIKKDQRGLDRALSEIDLQAKEIRKKQKLPEKREVRLGPADLHLGERVKILSLNQVGTLVEGPDKAGEVQIQMGILRIQSNVSDLARVAEETIQKPSRVEAKTISQSKAMEQKAELDLRGYRFEEAMDRADKYLDDSVLTGYHKVRIIHGKGTGALRKGLHDRLRKDRRVASFAFADEREGGSGATDIVLK